MKKLVLIIVCALLLVFFISFNYLLWERQSSQKNMDDLKFINVSSSTKISAYEKQIKSLEAEVERLNESVELLEEDKRRLDFFKSELIEQKSQLEASLSNRNQLIDGMKAQIDPSAWQEVIFSWAEALNTGEYEKAFGLMAILGTEEEQALLFRNFQTNFCNEIASIHVLSVKLKERVTENTDGTIINTDSGRVILDITLEVQKIKGNSNYFYQMRQGINHMYFQMNLNANTQNSNVWVIEQIQNMP